MEIFYYIKTDDLNDTINYGIKLSENYTRKIIINNIEKIFLVGLLNPKDDLEKFNDKENYCCVKLLINNINLKVADGCLYGTGYYESSIIDLEEYELGRYMKPEVLISMSILPEDIEKINYEIDFPLLYDNSEELYKNNLIELLSLELPNSKDIILQSLLDEYSKKNNFVKKQENGINIYISDNMIFKSK